MIFQQLRQRVYKRQFPGDGFPCRLFGGMNGVEVAHRLTCPAIGAVVFFDEERTILFLFYSGNRTCLNAVIVFLAFVLVDNVRHHKPPYMSLAASILANRGARGLILMSNDTVMSRVHVEANVARRAGM